MKVLRYLENECTERLGFSRESRKGEPLGKKPLDGGGSRRGSFPISLHDKMMGNKKAPPSMEKKDFSEVKLARIGLISGNKLAPMIYLEKKVVDQLSLPWTDALQVKILGKR